jgi:hypothetical protein
MTDMGARLWNSSIAMIKTLEVINEVIHDPKHAFRKVENHPKKPRKHRYERRKIRAYLQPGAWAAGDLV